VPAPATNGSAGSDAPVMTLISYGGKLTRNELAQVPTPVGTATHKPIPHIEVVEKLIETLSFRQIGVVSEEYAVSSDGMRMFGVMSRLNWKWRERSAVKITERTWEKTTETLHRRREGRHSEAAFAGAGACFEAL
ncbi:MAG: hypothetical protein ACM32G_04375, partial [Betaproteobacteria bacterium]